MPMPRLRPRSVKRTAAKHESPLGVPCISDVGIFTNITGKHFPINVAVLGFADWGIGRFVRQRTVFMDIW